ncbi:UDP-glucose 4-epimerase GalE [Achromobacter aloeverae]|uniref:UDP-glucose 4-epimerase n=1 Tax=Achromobacter aloeverae TaxID=1750518 RepID=A0A4Q1HIS7_9BURK|nr:UDP-glucose 4-epimerase GalE [Achromobacter aloeverae]RXN86166.1 UDP-glucose 4-epimerase GalE [Achromobacter aloeverae]
MSERILVTGGAGYIGSHILVELAKAGHRPVVLDNLATGNAAAVAQAGLLAGMEIPLWRGDVRSAATLRRIFETWRRAGDPIRQVIHLAGMKSVPESMAAPLQYYDVNLHGSTNLVRAMLAYDARHLVFSSSATVYGAPARLPIRETAALSPCTPYGHSKRAVEQMLADVCNARADFRATVLRYFNPVGAHPSGRIGEAPAAPSSNLFPCIAQVATGLRPHLVVFGRDYPTRDGTAVRDYLHVSDLALGHVKALCGDRPGGGWRALNLGTGQGSTVMELLDAFERQAHAHIPYVTAQRRPGDVAELWADVALAEQELGWRATRSLDQMCRDGWRWQASHPDGYKEPRR